MLAVLQTAQPAPSPVARVEVTPASAEVAVGQTLQLSARALDADGRPVPDARLVWFGNGEGAVDSTGLVTGGYQGYLQVTAVAVVRGAAPVYGFARVRIKPLGPASVEIAPVGGEIVAGSRLTLSAATYSIHRDRRDDPVTYSSSNSRVLTVTTDGRLRAVAPGRATITAKAGSASSSMPLRVIPNTIARLEIEPATQTIRTGDVLALRAVARAATGRSVSGFAARWAVEAGAGVAQIGDDGRFVAEKAGTYTVTVQAGTQTADAMITVTPT